MKIIVTSPGVSIRERRYLENELTDHLPCIKRRLVTKDEASRILRARLTRTGSAEAPHYTLTLTVHLPDSPVVVQKKGMELRLLISQAAAALKKELNRAGARIRKDHLRRRRHTTRESFAAFARETAAEPASPAPEPDITSHPVFARLRPITGRIYSYAREHIRAAALAGEIPLNYLSAHDLVDQAIIRVIETDRLAKMDGQALEHALYGYIDALIEEEASRHHPQQQDMLSLDSASDIDAFFQQPHPEEEQAEFYQPFEALRLQDVLADQHVVDPEHQMSDREEYRLILKRLAGFPPKARSAFFLNLMEGFEPFEIGMMQGREEAKVLADVEACREALKEGLAATGRRKAGAA